MADRIKILSRNLLLLALAAGAAYGIWRILLLELKPQGPGPAHAFVFENMHMRVWKDDKVRWELWAGRVEISRGKDVYTITNIKKGLLYRNNKIYRFKAARAFYDSTNKQVRIYGRINFQTEKGDEFFRSRDAFWDGNAETLRLPNPVAVMEGGNLFAGDSFQAMGEELENFAVIGHVTVIIPDVKDTEDSDMLKELEDAAIEAGDIKNLVLKAQRVEHNSRAGLISAYPARVWTPEPQAPPSELVPARAPGLPGGMPPPINVPGGALPPPPGLDILPGLDPSAPGLPMMPFTPPSLETPPLPPLHVSLSTDAWNIRAGEIHVRDKEKLARAAGRVYLVRKGRKPDKKDRKLIKALKRRDALIVTEELRYFWRLGRAEIDYPLIMRQKELTLAANSGLVLTKLDRAELRGGVILRQTGGKWLFSNKVIEDGADDKVKDIARAQTTISAASVDLDFDKEDVLATGDVSVMQKDRFLTAGTAAYSGLTKTWEIFGNVTVRDKEDYYEAPLFTYNEDTGALTAPQGAYFELLPDEDQRADFSDYFMDRDGDAFDKQKFQKEKVFVRGNDMRFDDGRDILTITGSADLRFKDVTLNADRVTVNLARETMRAEGRVTIKDKNSTLTADWADADWNTEIYKAGGGVKIAHTGNLKQDSDPFELKGAELVWNRKTGAGSVTGDPALTSRGRRATADSMDFNSKEKIYTLEGDVQMQQDNGDWLRGKDYIDADDTQAWAIAKKPTKIKCRSARLEPDSDYFLLEGAVRVTQPEKEALADRIEFWGKKKRLVMEGSVRMSQSGGDWLFEGGFVDDTDDEDMRKRARKPADITCKRLESLYGERRLLLTGGVRITQGKSSVEGDSLWHYGKTKQTVIEGGVKVVDEDGRSLKAKRVIYDGEAKTVEAFNSITGEGYINENKNRRR